MPGVRALQLSLPSEDRENSAAFRAHVSAKERVATVAICLAIALVAIGVRLLLWQDNRPIFPRIFTGMVEHHKANARVLLNGDVTHFITGPAPPEDANILTYPPGYPLVMALVFRLFGDSDTAMRIFQILCDGAAAVLLFFIAAAFLPRKAAVVAGFLAAISPQLAYYSLLLLPDSLATLPILLAVYFIIRAIKSPRLWLVIAAGICVGLSCWLRSNALLLAPFLAIILLMLIERGRRWKYAAAFCGAAVLVIAPITIRNAIVFHHFVPLSLGAGQMLNVGIGDYDKERRFGLPGTDLETVTSEAARYNRPDYAHSLFGGNGIQRDQDRTTRGLAVVRSHPVWFGQVVLRRALTMLKLERVRTVSSEPAVTHSLEAAQRAAPVWSKRPAELVTNGQDPQQSRFTESPDGNSLEIEASADRQAAIFVLPMAVEKNSDYLLKVPVKVTQGNLIVTVQPFNQGAELASSPVLHPLEVSAILAQPTFLIEVPFVNRDADSVALVITNEGSRPVATVAQIGRMELFRLGTASPGWTRYPRVIIHVAQRFFLTAWLLPVAIAGALLLLSAGQRRYLLVLLAVPLYYVCAQSVLHTEYRYVMAIQYSLFVLGATALYALSALVAQGFRKWSSRSNQTD
jgi:hypothetical protein